MRRMLIALVLSIGISLPNASVAAEPSKSLAMLVRTLRETDNENVQGALLRGMLKGLDGRRDVPAPDGWQQLSAQLLQSDRAEIRDLTEQLSQIFGDQRATQRALATLRDEEAAPAVRRRALHALLTQRNQEVAQELDTLLDQPAMRLDAIRGYAVFELPHAPQLLLKHYKHLQPQEQQAILETVSTRKSYALALVAALRTNSLDRQEIPAYIARSLREIVGEEFTRVYGEIPELAGDATELITAYKGMITPEALAAANASKGRTVYQNTCAACHVLYGEGGKIGPDLTGSNRANLDYILLNSLAPSYDVPAGYRMVIIETEDGRVLNGVIGAEDDQRIVLKTVDQPEMVITKADIATRTLSEKSMMPEGQLQQLETQEIIDLIGYLRTTEQIEMAE